MDSKKRLSAELIILGVLVVLAGAFAYMQQKNIAVTDLWSSIMGKIKPINQDLVEVEKEKAITEQNYKNFVRNNGLDILTNSAQYQDLRSSNVSVPLENIGNPDPFNKPIVVENQQ